MTKIEAAILVFKSLPAEDRIEHIESLQAKGTAEPVIQLLRCIHQEEEDGRVAEAYKLDRTAKRRTFIRS